MGLLEQPVPQGEVRVQSALVLSSDLIPDRGGGGVGGEGQVAVRRSRGCPVFAQPATEPPEEPAAQYLHIAEAEEDVQGTQAAVAALQDLRYTSESGSVLYVGGPGGACEGGQVMNVIVAAVMCPILPFTWYPAPPPFTDPRGQTPP